MSAHRKTLPSSPAPRESGRRWIARPWIDAEPDTWSSLRARGFRVVDLRMADDGSAALERAVAHLEALRRRRPGPLGLLGVDRLATLCLELAKSARLDVASLVLVPGSFEVLGAPPSRCAVRWIATEGDRDLARRVVASWGDPSREGVAVSEAGPSGRIDLSLVPSVDARSVERLAVEWFDATLPGSLAVDLLERLRARLRGPRVRRQVAAGVQASTLLVALAGPQMRAATLHVDENCSLVDAIGAAEADEEVGGCSAGDGADTVVLQGGVYPLASLPGEGLPVITTPVTVEGHGARLDGEGQERVLTVQGGDLTVVDATVTGGAASTGGGVSLEAGTVTLVGATVTGNTADLGGGVYNRDGRLWLADSTITGNHALAGGGVYQRATSPEGSTVWVLGGSLAGNTANHEGGAIASVADEGGNASVVLEGATVTANVAERGGGVAATGVASGTVSVLLAGATVSANTASTSGGGLILTANGQELAGTVSVLGSVLTGNTAGGDGGAIHVAAAEQATVSVQLTGGELTGNTASGGGALALMGELGATVGLQASHTTLAGNSASLDGGAVRAEGLEAGSVTVGVSGGELRGNRAGRDGGGLFVRSADASSSVSVVGATLEANSVSGRGGAIFASRDGILGASVSIEASTLHGNTADAAGGAVELGSAGESALAARIVNSTISGNTAGLGSGLRVATLDGAEARVDVDNSALAGNSAGIGAAFELLGESSGALEAELRNSIVTKNVGGECAVEGSGAFLGGDNLVDGAGVRGAGARGDASACAGLGEAAVTGFDEQLADNGGPTPTHALLPGSNAIDAGAGDCEDLRSDQRGARRPLDGDGDEEAVCDIGPFEAGETPVFGDGFESGGTSAWEATSRRARVESGGTSERGTPKPVLRTGHAPSDGRRGR